MKRRVVSSSTCWDLLSDRTGYMDFIRCSSDHHAIAYTTIDSPTLNHVAFEMPSHNALMYGAGRMKQTGYPTEWGRASWTRKQHLRLFRRSQRVCH